jgi:hypothetical protein
MRNISLRNSAFFRRLLLLAIAAMVALTVHLPMAAAQVADDDADDGGAVFPTQEASPFDDDFPFGDDDGMDDDGMDDDGMDDDGMDDDTGGPDDDGVDDDGVDDDGVDDDGVDDDGADD